jgi:hypothetical protein
MGHRAKSHTLLRNDMIQFKIRDLNLIEAVSEYNYKSPPPGTTIVP